MEIFSTGDSENHCATHGSAEMRHIISGKLTTRRDSASPDTQLDTRAANAGGASAHGPQSSHTPIPWEAHYHHHADGDFWCSIGYKGFGPILDIVGEQGHYAQYYQVIGGMKYLVTPVGEQKANAEFIVRACNSHDALLAAMREIAKGNGEFSRDPLTHATNTIESMKTIAREAIELAEGR